MSVIIPADILIELRFVLATLVMFGGAIACFSYASTNQRRRAKKPVYLAAGFGFVGMMIVYGMASAGIDVYLLKSGWLTVIGMIYLSGLYIAGVIADWRKM